jgi:hypothetical protein
MHLWVNNEPAHVYVPESNVKQTYETLQSRLSKEGSIPIGIDHLPDNIINENPILGKLDLLNVGEITEIEYANDTISIVEAELTNPLIRQLYEAGELDMVSIVATSHVSECPNDYDYIVNTTDITRVDIVEKGACTSCNIPKPHDDDTVVYARYSIKEEEPMADELTAETIKQMFDEALKPIYDRLDKTDKAIEELKGSKDPEPPEENEEIKAREAEINKKAAEVIVDTAIMAGKVTPAERDSNVELCASNPEAYEEALKSKPIVVSLEERISLLAGESEEEEEEEEEVSEEDENLKNVLAHFSGDE